MIINIYLDFKKNIYLLFLDDSCSLKLFSERTEVIVVFPAPSVPKINNFLNK